MDLAPELSLTFEQMAEFVRSKKPLPFDQLEEQLEFKRKIARTVRAARESGLARDARLSTLNCVFSDEEYCRGVIHILSTDLPLFEEDLDDENDLTLYTQPMGLNNYIEDDVYEMSSDPSDCRDEMSLTVFLMLLNYGICDPEPWMACIERFNWPIEEAFSVQWGSDIDRSYLRRYFKRKGLPELFDAIQMALIPDGNPFLCGSPEDLDSICFEITGENIKYLYEAWDEAERLLSGFEKASRMVAVDPSLVAMIGKALERSQKSKGRVRV